MTDRPTAKPDIYFEDHGSICLLRPYTLRGDEWLNDHLPEDAPMHGNAFAVEPGYVLPIIEGAEDDGLTVA
jgi:hypothetical protein